MRIPANLYLMIGSVLISMLLWLWVGAEERSEIVVNVPLQYRNLSRNYEIADKNLVPTVNIWVKGSTTAIKTLRPQDVVAWVDLEKAKPGAKNFELEQDHIRVPYGLTVLRVSPSRISLRIEETVIRLVPVTVRTEGEPRLGYNVSQTTVVPPQVEIRGPQSAVATVRHVITDSIDVSNISGNHVEVVNIGVDNSEVRLGNTKTVRVSLTVSPIQDLVTLRIPVTVDGTDRNVKLNPKVVLVDLMGPKNVLAEINDTHVKALLQLDKLQTGIYQLTPQLVLEKNFQKNVSVHSVTPARIHVRIQ